MGGAFEMLAVAVSSGGAATALARTLTSWLQTRRPDVSVTVTTADRSVTFHASDLDASAVMPMLHQVLNSNGNDGNVAD